MAADDSPDVHDELFELRLERWLPGLRGPACARSTASRPGPCWASRRGRSAPRTPPAGRRLRLLDQRRLLRPDWFQGPDMLGYAAYTERFAGDLRRVGSEEVLGYLEELGVTYLHLLPLLHPAPGRQRRRLRGHGLPDRAPRPRARTRTSPTSPTPCTSAASACASTSSSTTSPASTSGPSGPAPASSGTADFFRVFADRTLPDAYEQTLPEVFPDFAPGSFTFDDELDAWVWTTFNSWQWDVDWSNPDVFVAYLEVVCHLANLGVDVLRLDAIAFLWKRLGTACQNEPEVHAITRALRAALRAVAPGVLLKAEAIVGPRDLVPVPRAPAGTTARCPTWRTTTASWSRCGRCWPAATCASPCTRCASSTPCPATTSWLTYVRCHDDIGWAVDDGGRRRGRAWTAGPTGRSCPTSTPGRSPARSAGAWCSSTTRRPGTGGSPARRPAWRASTPRSSTRTGRSAAAADDLVVARLLLAHAVAMGFGGMPVLWSGDELGLRDDRGWADEPGHEGDNRWAHRPRLPWTMNLEREHVGRPDRPRDGGRAGLPGPGAARRGPPRACRPAARVVPDRGPRPAAPGRARAAAPPPRGPDARPLQRHRATRSRSPAGCSACTGCTRAWTGSAASGCAPTTRGSVTLEPYGVRWLVAG